MKQQKANLTVIDENGEKDAIDLELVDGAYCTIFDDCKQPYGVMLPGDTITVVYNFKELATGEVTSVEIDYTFTEPRVSPEGVQETDYLNRIVTYFSDFDFSNEFAQGLYDKLVSPDFFTRDDVFEPLEIRGYEITVNKRLFYSNYLSRLANTGKRNIITVNRNNKGWKP